MRDRGTFNFSGNLEVKKDAPLEARSLVNSYADLVKPETWTDEQGGIWKYDCMLVSCKDRPGEVYQLQPGADYTKQSSWILIGDTSELNSKVQQFINSKGAPNGLASLNESGIIPSAQLPSYVDDVIEVDTFSNLPGTGESGKIYIVQDTNLTYRWSGTGYVEISKSLALGETSSTAYPGDKGKATTDKLNRIPDKLITDTVNVNQSTTEAVLNFTTYRQEAQQIGRNTLTITSATTSNAGVMSATDKVKVDKIVTDGDGNKYLTDNGTYKSDINIIKLQDIRDIISIVYHEKDRASSDISLVFGGSANFRAIVNDILKTHTRYFFHVKDTPDTDCIQLSGVNAWKNIDNTQYELHFVYNYYIPNGNQRTCRRVTVIDSDNTDSNLFIVENVNDMYVLSKDRDRRKSVSLVGEGFDENHWYPVSFTADPDSIVPPCNLIIWNSLNNDSAGISPKPSWATNSGGFVLHIDMTIIGNGYGQYTYARNKLNNWHGEWGGETAVGEMQQTTQTSTFYIYLRGGANYFYTSDYADLKMTAHSSEVSDGYNTYSIKDTQGNIKDFFTYVENDLFEEVKNLQIVHDNEFNFANDNIGGYVWINYRSRYDAVTSAKAIYIGNGQAGADGAYGAVHASGFFKGSDIRLKSDIAPLKHTLDQICEIPTVEFNMHDKHQIGTVAQNLENNFAEIVNTDSDGMKSVDYCMLGVVAIEGIKLLKQEVEDLKKQIEELKNGK